MAEPETAAAPGVLRTRRPPSVAVVLVGAWDVVDHRIDGNILPVGSDAWVLYMTHQLDTATEVLSARGARVVLMTSPCFVPTDSGLGGIPERSDAARVHNLNDTLRAYAKTHPARVSLVDLHGFLCPKGVHAHRCRRDGSGPGRHAPVAGGLRGGVAMALRPAQERGPAPDPMTCPRAGSNGP
jgi:hypothetical protein